MALENSCPMIFICLFWPDVIGFLPMEDSTSTTLVVSMDENSFPLLFRLDVVVSDFLFMLVELMLE